MLKAHKLYSHIPRQFNSKSLNLGKFKSFSTTPTEGFLSGTSAYYVEEMYAAWLKDPLSVHVSWQAYFKNIGSSRFPAFVPPPTLIPTVDSLGYDGAVSISSSEVPSLPSGEILDHMKVQLMVRAYQVRGHHLARLDPLGINFGVDQKAPELDYTHYGFKESDLDRKFHLGSGILPAFKDSKSQLTLREIIKALKDIYCTILFNNFNLLS